MDLIFPLETPWAVPVSAGIVLSEMTTLGGGDAGGAALLEALMERDSAAAEAQTDAGNALRTVEDHSVSADDAGQSTLRTVRYTWSVPASATLLTSTMSISGDGADEHVPIIDALTELFDAMMQTLRWREGQVTA